MAGYATKQVGELRDALTIARRRIDRTEETLTTIRQIARDHESCECSAALMILEVLDRG